MGYPVFLQKTSVFVETCFYQTKKGCRTLCPAAPIGNGKFSLRAPYRNYIAAKAPSLMTTALGALETAPEASQVMPSPVRPSKVMLVN